MSLYVLCHMRVNLFFAIEFDQTVYYNALDKAFAQGGTGARVAGRQNTGAIGFILSTNTYIDYN